MNTSTMDHFYAVTGMTCGGCAQRVSAALNGVDGVAEAAVTLAPPQARLKLSKPISPGVLNAALQRIGAYALSETAGAPPQPTVAVGKAPESLYPLFLIVGYIAVTVGLVTFVSADRATATGFMTNFMAGFFLVFSFFKLLDLRGFADAYRSYDLVAKVLPGWGFVYPFIELGLGVAYLLRISPIATNGLTLALMLVGSLGVFRALLNKRAILCACLGTALKLPMTKVTLVEDLGMAAMAAAMLAMTAL
jgi:copper chaperone CopZ